VKIFSKQDFFGHGDGKGAIFAYTKKVVLLKFEKSSGYATYVKPLLPEVP
jgi:hypothetical protein